MRNGFGGYDQWKKASPYDDDMGPEYETECPTCGEEDWEYQDHKDEITAILYCPHCKADFEYRADGFKKLTDDQKEERNRLYKLLHGAELTNEVPTLDELFLNAPDGDFHWEGEPGAIGTSTPVAIQIVQLVGTSRLITLTSGVKMAKSTLSE